MELPASSTGCAVFPKKIWRSTIAEMQMVVRFPPHHFGNQMTAFNSSECRNSQRWHELRLGGNRCMQHGDA
jgi:hypothetical protein